MEDKIGKKATMSYYTEGTISDVSIQPDAEGLVDLVRSMMKEQFLELKKTTRGSPELQQG